MNLTVIDHPLTSHYLTVLRDRTTEPEEFRSAARRLTYTLVMEATKQVPLLERRGYARLRPVPRRATHRRQWSVRRRRSKRSPSMEPSDSR